MYIIYITILGCGVAQVVVHRLAVRQARVRFSARHPMEPSLSVRIANEDIRPRQMLKDERMYDCIV